MASPQAAKAAWDSRAVIAANKQRAAANQPRLTGAEERQFRAAYRQEKDRGYTHGNAIRRALASLGTATPAAAAPAPAAAAASTTSSIKQRMAATAAPPTQTTATPAADPIAEALKQLKINLKPTWETKAGTFRCWSPQGTGIVELPVAATPGSHTPKEQIHDILGQPEMIYNIAAAIAEREFSLLEGPSGVAKTTAYRWLAKQLNWNVLTIPMHKDIESADLVGEPKPAVNANGELIFEWVNAQLTKAALLSLDPEEPPTIFVFEELNRVANQQVFARLYPLLDDTRQLEISEKAGAGGATEVISPDRERFFIGATMNPAESEDANAAVSYIGVQVLDPAFRNRFFFQPRIDYPPEPLEAEALRRRVPSLSASEALQMVRTATQVRKDPTNPFPFSFRDMVAWAKALKYYGWEDAAEVGVISKVPPDFKPAVRNLVTLKPTAAGATP
jgi:MoxR-like ATPase